MKIQFHVLATDTDMGTEVFAFLTEEEAYRHLYQVVENSSEDDDEKPTFEEFLEDPYEFYQQFKHDDLDHYILDQIVLDIPITKVIADGIRLHPFTQAVARRGRAALRFAREILGRANRSHSA